MSLSEWIDVKIRGPGAVIVAIVGLFLWTSTKAPQELAGLLVVAGILLGAWTVADISDGGLTD